MALTRNILSFLGINSTTSSPHVLEHQDIQSAVNTLIAQFPSFATTQAALDWQAAEVAAGRPGFTANMLIRIG